MKRHDVHCDRVDPVAGSSALPLIEQGGSPGGGLIGSSWLGACPLQKEAVSQIVAAVKP